MGPLVVPVRWNRPPPQGAYRAGCRHGVNLSASCLAQASFGLDERAPNVTILDQPSRKDARSLGWPMARRGGRIGHRDDRSASTGCSRASCGPRSGALGG
jgi:hypothetical protein